MATLLISNQTSTPGPKISYAWKREKSTRQPGENARASISGVAQIDSTCRPRPDCQVNGDTSRVQPPVIRLSPASPKPTATKAQPAGLRSGR